MPDNSPTTKIEDFNWVKNNGIFMPMINDTGRNKFYKAAIEDAVKDKIVVDIGAGTGMLSFLAARAGARKVYVIEMDRGRADFAKILIEKLEMSDVIEVVNKNFLDTSIPSDIYVSETIGNQLFDENIIGISEHARQHGGEFIPSKFEVWAEVYDDHPIFALVQTNSDAFEFQPDIEIHPAFKSNINVAFQTQHPATDTLYRANTIVNLFAMLPKFNDLRLTKIFKTDNIVVDLNSKINIDDIKLTIPYSVAENKTICVVLFWKAIYGKHQMHVSSTIWANPNKVILSRVKVPKMDITMWYDPILKDWRLNF